VEKKQVSVDQLQFGMFVAELDRPWTETPFMFQGFVLRTEQQLEALKKYCKHVFVDVEKSEPTTGAPPAARPQPGAAPREEERPAAAPRPPTAKFKISGATAYPERVSVEAEFANARSIYQESAAKLGDLLRPLAKPGGVLDGPQVKESVTRITDSVVRNPDALLLVSRLRETSAEVHARALQVSVYMIVFARFLKLAREELELLGLLGLLQDVGKTKLSPGLLEKKGKLTPEERELTKKHVEYSAEILGSSPGLPPKLPELALLHHERQDGSGYPKALKGEQIGLYGSMAAIVDTFEALTAVRPHSEPLSPSAALSFLYKERGTRYHADLVEQFIQCVGVFPVGAVVELNSAEVGIVITQNLVRRLKPRVMVVVDAQGNPMRPHKILDLDKDPHLRPDEPYRIRRTLEQTRIQVDPRELFM
jgi:HD-GYP domain-containing protein (c-di-GMP phosphodiesterase class II)